MSASLKRILGFGLVALIAGALCARRAGAFRGARAPEEDGPRQWPFDPGELRALMGHVFDDQQRRIDQLPAGPAQARARRFLAYYEGRTAAAARS